MPTPCRCCLGSSSSSSQSGSSSDCTCCTDCGCCCMALPANPPYWTTPIILTGGLTGVGPSGCRWAGRSNVWVSGDFGFHPLCDIEVNGSADPNKLGVFITAGGGPFFSYSAPDGYDWTSFCNDNVPITLTLDGGGGPYGGFLTEPPATMIATPVPARFLGGDPLSPHPCCFWDCGPSCSSQCMYQSAGPDGGPYTWELFESGCDVGGEPALTAGPYAGLVSVVSLTFTTVIILKHRWESARSPIRPITCLRAGCSVPATVARCTRRVTNQPISRASRPNRNCRRC